MNADFYYHNIQLNIFVINFFFNFTESLKYLLTTLISLKIAKLQNSENVEI